MNSDNLQTNFQAVKADCNFAAIASENRSLVENTAPRPTFDTSLPTRSPSAHASSSMSSSKMPEAVPVALSQSQSSNNHKKRSSRSIDDSAEDILEQSKCDSNILILQLT
jgi:hypothetical protein